MKFTFGDIVVVREEEIGVVVKCWDHPNGDPARERTYEVYVRTDNRITTFEEKDIQRYMVRHKYLSKEEKEYQANSQKD